MENLPLEIGLDIFSRLPISSIIRLRSVSKSLRSIAENPRLRPLYLAHASRRDPSILLHSYGGCSQLHRLVDDPGTTTTAVRICSGAGADQDFTELSPAGSCNGFLLLCNTTTTNSDQYINSSPPSTAPPVCLWNPFTGHQIQLPKPNPSFPEPQRVAIGLGPDPATSAPKIVRILYYNRPTMFGSVWTSQVQVLTVGGAWREMGRTAWNLKPGPSEATLLVNIGALHWLTVGPGREKIVSFDLREEAFGEIPFPAACFEGQGRELYRISHLTALSGRLSAVVSASGPEATPPVEVWAMTEYGSWARDFVVIGNHLPPSLNPSSSVRLLCKLVSSGRAVFLVQFGEGRLASYCPENQEWTELVVSGLPPLLFSATLHMESM